MLKEQQDNSEQDQEKNKEIVENIDLAMQQFVMDFHDSMYTYHRLRAELAGSIDAGMSRKIAENVGLLSIIPDDYNRIAEILLKECSSQKKYEQNSFYIQTLIDIAETYFREIASGGSTPGELESEITTQYELESRKRSAEGHNVRFPAWTISGAYQKLKRLMETYRHK